jgi:tRNA threonylcarbamoyl adenosine modification protein (Sua5/YciO/YrdC/YwlC family)
MIIRLHPDNPDPRRVQQIVELLERDALIVIPTDTVYSFACKLGSTKGMERMARLKGVKLEKAPFSLACADLSQMSFYSKPVTNEVFKLMRRALPGPYTFILQATTQVPKLFRGNKKTIGIRVPDHGSFQAVVSKLGTPLVVSSVHDEDAVVEYTTDPELIEERFAHSIDAVVDGGLGRLEASTVLDCTQSEVLIVREGLGPLDSIL